VEGYAERSVFENRLGMLGVWVPDFGAWGGREELACAEDAMVLMAPIVAAPAADALEFKSSKRLAAVGPVVLVCAAGVEQV